MPHCWSGLTLPTRSPSRPASTVPTCSTRTRVVAPSSSMSGRNDAGRAFTVGSSWASARRASGSKRTLMADDDLSYKCVDQVRSMSLR